MAGLGSGRGVRCSLTVLVLTLAAALAVGCKSALDLKAVIEDRVAQANFEYGTKTLLTGQKYAASVAVNGSKVYVLYYDSAAQNLCVVKSSDGGKSWNAPYTVDSTVDYYGVCNNLVVDQNHIYICYYASRGPDTDYFVELTDTGSSFSSSNFQAVSTYKGYPYGYESSISFDNTNVYIVYSAGGAPAYTYAAKGTTMSFLAQPIPIDASFPNPAGSNGNRKRSSIYADGNNVNVSYSDNVQNRLRIATFAPSGAGLPMTVTDLNIGGAASTDYPSLSEAGTILDVYYDGTAKALRCYEHYSYVSGLNLFIVSKAITIDSSSTNVGSNCRLVYTTSDSTAYVAYYDATNKQLKFASGQQNKSITPPDFQFNTSVLATVGGTNFDCSMATDGTSLYIVYFDSSGTGALKIAKSADGGLTW
ncbi:MAG TPA: hypothetical protein VMC79_07215 [Rectinemataceae bacterium]|nr:hypothetical protein [Rectinemataceae bacterium]